MKFLINNKSSTIEDLRKKYKEKRAEIYNNAASYIAEQASYNAPVLQDGTDLANHIKLQQMPEEGGSAVISVDHPAAFRAHEYPYEPIQATKSMEHRSQTGGIQRQFLTTSAYMKLDEIMSYIKDSVTKIFLDRKIDLLGTKRPSDFPPPSNNQSSTFE